MVEVSIYRNVFDTTGQFTIPIEKALERIKNGKSRESIIGLRAESDSNRQQDLKKKLVSVTFSGKFSERVDEKIVSHSGFLCLDFDDVSVSEYKEKFIKWEYSYAVWASPRATGVKVLLKIANGKKHREHFAALKKLFPNTDPLCANESRVCYESYDPEIYINTASKTFSEAIKFEIVEDRKVSVDTFEVYKKLITWTETSIKSDKSFHEKNRNNFAYVLSGAACRFGLSETDVCSLVVSDYSQSDFTKNEIERTVRSAYSKNKNAFGTAEFSNSNFRTKETHYEVDIKVLQEGFKPDDVIYGSDVYEKAVEIYTHGYKSAESTHIAKLDQYWKWKKRELTLMTGIGNYGKSFYFNQLQLIKSYFDGDKWAVFSPENCPPEEYYFDLVEMLLGCACDGGYNFKPDRQKFDAAYEFVSKHFFYVYPESISPSPEFIKTKFLELILKEKVTGVVIDPFNQLSNDYGASGGRSDKYLESFLSDCQRFANLNDVYFLLIAHPHKLKKDPNGNYPEPDIFDIADGAMWNNKCDNILVYHRPNHQTDPDSAICEHHSKKIRRQKMIGKKGSFEFSLDRKKRRFQFDGSSPLDGNRFDSSRQEAAPLNGELSNKSIHNNPNSRIESVKVNELGETLPF